MLIDESLIGRVGMSTETFQEYVGACIVHRAMRNLQVEPAIMNLPFDYYLVVSRFCEELELVERILSNAHKHHWSASQLDRRLTVDIRRLSGGPRPCWCGKDDWPREIKESLPAFDVGPSSKGGE